MIASVALTAIAGLASLPLATAQFKIDTRDNIVASARTLAFDLMSEYEGNKTGKIPGILPGPPAELKGEYYWWEWAAFAATFIDYWRKTGDDTYNAVITQGLLHQRSSNNDYMPLNQTATIGNDDHCFWGLAAMTAAENKFPEPTGGAPGWLQSARNVLDAMQQRFDAEDKAGTCGGGLRWQIPPTNQGYDYKNTISNACLFNLAARVGRYTGNTTYTDQATKALDWLLEIGFITDEYRVFDGAHVQQNCTDINKAQFSYNGALLAEGMAFQYNATNGADVWKNHLTKMVDATLRDFFPKDVAFEAACESRKDACTPDMVAFKSLLHRYLTTATQLAPHIAPKLLPVLRKSAEAGAAQCTGGDSGRKCGFYWAEGEYVEPETTGVGETMNVLSAVTGLLVEGAPGPVTEKGATTPANGGGGSNGTTTQGAPGANQSQSKAMATRAEMKAAVAVVAGLGLYYLL